MNFPTIEELKGALYEYSSAMKVEYDEFSHEFILTHVTYTTHPDGMGVMDELEFITKHTFKQAYDIWHLIENFPNWDSLQGEWYVKTHTTSLDRYLNGVVDYSPKSNDICEELPF